MRLTSYLQAPILLLIMARVVAMDVFPIGVCTCCQSAISASAVHGTSTRVPLKKQQGRKRKGTLSTARAKCASASVASTWKEGWWEMGNFVHGFLDCEMAASRSYWCWKNVHFNCQRLTKCKLHGLQAYRVSYLRLKQGVCSFIAVGMVGLTELSNVHVDVYALHMGVPLANAKEHCCSDNFRAHWAYPTRYRDTSQLA